MEKKDVLEDMLDGISACNNKCSQCVTEGKLDYNNITEYCAVRNRLTRLNSRINKSHLKVLNKHVEID